MSAAVCTPNNTLSRDNLSVLIRNNTITDSIELKSDSEMDTNSPMRQMSSLKPISKKLFHSPLAQQNSGVENCTDSKTDRKRKSRKRKQFLIPSSNEKIKKAYVCEREANSEMSFVGMRQKVLVSMIHNKEYSMDLSE